MNYGHVYGCGWAGTYSTSTSSFSSYSTSADYSYITALPENHKEPPSIKIKEKEEKLYFDPKDII